MSGPGAESVPAALAAARLSEPAWVRDGSAKVQREYALALQFEKLLVQQLASSLTESGGPLGEGDGAEAGAGSGAGPVTSVLSNMIPGALADGVVAGGGLGLAAELTKELEGSVHDAAATSGPSTAAAPSGGVEADVTGGARA